MPHQHAELSPLALQVRLARYGPFPAAAAAAANAANLVLGRRRRLHRLRKLHVAFDPSPNVWVLHLLLRLTAALTFTGIDFDFHRLRALTVRCRRRMHRRRRRRHLP